MGYFFLALVTSFTVLCWAYLLSNDFAKETLETIFPAIGAIFLSVYLGYKSVVLDRPATKVFGGTVVVLHDPVQGAVSGLALRAAASLPGLAGRHGLTIIDSLPHYDAF